MRPVRMWIGLVLFSAGVVGMLGAIDVLDAGAILARWWPVAVVGLGLAALVAQRSVSPGPLVVTAIGLALLGDTQGWPVDEVLWPAVLIVVGVLLLTGLSRRRGAEQGSALAIFGGSSVQDRSDHLTHAEVSALFGGATLDLRAAHIDEHASVDAFAMFGGVDVLVPEGWRIDMRGLPIFGGYEDKTDRTVALPPDAPVLTVNATALFGGVAVKHKPRATAAAR